MPSEKTNFPRESTMKEMANALAMIAVAQASNAGDITSGKAIAQIVRSGLGPRAFPVGSRLTVAHSEYGSIAIDVAAHNHHKKPGDPDAPTMTLLMHHCIDQLMEMEILLTIKYEMVLQGFNAAKQAAPQPEKPPAEEPTGKKTHRGGRKRLTMDDIDRIFEIFFTMTAEEKDLIRGLLDSDKERRAAVP